MARKNPLGRIKDAASETVKDPIGTATRAAGQALGQARGTVEIGKAVAGQVTRSAAGVIASRVPGRRGTAPSGSGLRAVQPQETASTPPATKAPAKKTAPSTPSGKLPPRKAGQPKTAAELVEDPDLPSPIESIGSTEKG